MFMNHDDCYLFPSSYLCCTVCSLLKFGVHFCCLCKNRAHNNLDRKGWTFLHNEHRSGWWR
ncbi:hypothetical protein Hdeb2414_s0002g00063931 [Helianthus debilis subsp. tardiflorus]